MKLSNLPYCLVAILFLIFYPLGWTILVVWHLLRHNCVKSWLKYYLYTIFCLFAFPLLTYLLLPSATTPFWLISFMFVYALGFLFFVSLTKSQKEIISAGLYSPDKC
jgi:hypothetical protein